MWFIGVEEVVHPLLKKWIGSRGRLPNIGYIGTCDPKGHSFSAVLVVNRVSILAIFIINRVWFLHS